MGLLNTTLINLLYQSNGNPEHKTAPETGAFSTENHFHSNCAYITYKTVSSPLSWYIYVIHLICPPRSGNIKPYLIFRYPFHIPVNCLIESRTVILKDAFSVIEYIWAAQIIDHNNNLIISKGRFKCLITVRIMASCKKEHCYDQDHQFLHFHCIPISLILVSYPVDLSFHFIDPVYISELEYGRSILFLSFKFFFQ